MDITGLSGGDPRERAPHMGVSSDSLPTGLRLPQGGVKACTAPSAARLQKALQLVLTQGLAE
eukprot:scaffold7061_cov354-Pinguiococcus_pyrenoidosus.AAC.4